MAGQILAKLQKNKSQWQFYNGFIKEQGFSSSFAFISASVPTDQIYDTFFNKRPKYKVKNIDKYAKKAQQVYMDRLNAAANEGMKASVAHAEAVDSKVFQALFEAAKRDMVGVLEGPVYKAYQKSSYFDNYVSTQIDAGAIASQMGFPSKAGTALADAKHCLIFGKKSAAKSFVQSAIEIKINSGNKRNAKVVDDVNTVLKGLDKIKINVGP